jgi:hypothetical protein
MPKFLTVLLMLVTFSANAQVNSANISRIIGILAADSMKGRRSGSPEADKASAFIASEFRKAGLSTLNGAADYFQSFDMKRSETISASASYDSTVADPADILVFAQDEEINWNNSGADKVWIPKGVNFGQRVFGLTREKGDHVVFADTSYRKSLARFRSFPIERFPGGGNLLVILAPQEPSTYKVTVKSNIITSPFRNVVGMIPGNRTDEYVIFSSHYDHLGIGKAVNGDSIFNGANDDASGTTAVITLAGQFAKVKKKPERTLIFVAFTAEESGGFGSTYFSLQTNHDKVMDMFNIEMIGTESKWGKNSAYITGFERTDFGTMLQENLKGSGFSFYPDPYPTQNLFFRSDNATLARLGVPAHTISTSKMDSEKFYHTVDDEVETLDMKNMAEIIKSIAISSKGIISGKQTPSRVKDLK